MASDHPLVVQPIERIYATSVKPKQPQKFKSWQIIIAISVAIIVLSAISQSQRRNDNIVTLPTVAAMSNLQPTSAARRTLPPAFTPTFTFTPTPEAGSVNVGGNRLVLPTATRELKTSYSISEWIVQEDTSGFDDSSTVVLYTISDESYQPYFEDEYPSLVVRCREGNIDVYVNTRSSVEIDFDDDFDNHPTIRARIDTNAVFSERMNVSTDGEGLFFPSPNAIISDMLGSDTMLFEWETIFGDVIEVTFPITGLSSEINQVYNACN